MDKLLTNLYGGYPFTWNDWRFAVDSLQACLEGFAKAFGDTYILSGCGYATDETHVVAYVNPGWVVVQGEPCYFPGGATLPGSTEFNTYFERVVSMDPAGAQTFEDGTTQNGWQLRRARLAQYPSSPPANTVRVDGARVPDLFLFPDPWHSMGGGGLPFETGWRSLTGFAIPRYRKELGRIVRLTGVVNAQPSLPGATDLVTVLPTGYRPSQDVWGVLHSINAGSPGVALAQVKDTGHVYIWYTSGAVPGAAPTFDLAGFPTFEAL